MGNSPGKSVKEKSSGSRRGVGADQKTARTDGPAVGEVLMGNIRTAPTRDGSLNALRTRQSRV